MTTTSEPAYPPLSRVPTGVSGLDTIVSGGLFCGGVYIVMGAPGTGKTTLASQIAFSHVASGGRALYVTLLSEMHARMLQHLQGFHFFDATAIGHGLAFVSAFKVLETEGLSGILGMIKRQVHEDKVTLLVIDGVVTAESMAPSDTELKKFVHALQVLMSLANCTALMLTNPGGRPSFPTHTMVDGIVELRDEPTGFRPVRSLCVLKFRGGEQLRGAHVFDITSDGITVHPRIESRPSPLPARIPAASPLRSGIAQLDAMLGGGFEVASSTLVLGPPGSGKTLLGLHYLQAGAKAGEPGLHFGFGEDSDELIASARAVGLDLAPHLDPGLVGMRAALSPEAGIDAVAEQLLDEVRRRGVRRLFVDGLGGFRAATTDPGRVAPLFAALLAELRALGVTTVISEDASEVLGSPIVPPTPSVASRVQNIILLRYVELRSQLHRLISIVKRRSGAHDRAIREFRIDNQGITVANTFASAEAILGGLAHVLPGGERPAPRAAPGSRKKKGKPSARPRRGRKS